MQNLLDKSLALIAIVILSPVLICCILVLRFTGEKEIFYKQERVGLDNKSFFLLKFATMLKNSPSIGSGTITLKDDPRVLPFGKFLRKTKINELPQLLNILNGSMNLIGPRPQTLRCFNSFPDDSKSIISSVKPGLSGVGSLIFRNEEEMLDGADDADSYYDFVIMPYKAQLEVWYVFNRSLLVDLKLIIATVWIVCLPSSKILWQLFPGLPKPPKALESKVGACVEL